MGSEEWKGRIVAREDGEGRREYIGKERKGRDQRDGGRGER